MRVQRTGNVFRVHTPAKLNLFLEILAKRNDGYHELATLMVAITIHDTLVLSPASSEGVSLQCDWSPGREAQRQARGHEGAVWEPLPAAGQNLVFRAVERLRDCANQEMGARILLHKRIPSAAGLGGASSDAAAALTAAATAWGLPSGQPQLTNVAAELGSDISFFLAPRGAAVCRGRGEQVEPLPRVPRYHFVVAKPPAGLSTADVYRHCRAATQPRDVEAAREAFLSGNPARLGRALYNGLQAPAAALSPWVRRLQDAFARLDVLGHQLSGSGTSYFGVCRSARHARRVAGQVRARIGGAVFPVTTTTAAAHG